MTTVEYTQIADEVLVSALAQMPLFDQFTLEQRQWLVAHSTVVEVAAGDHIFVEAQPPDAFWVLVEGEWRITHTLNRHETTLIREDQPGTWGGYIPWVTGVAQLNGQALRPSRFLRVAPAIVQQMFLGGFPIAPHILAGLSWGVRNFETVVRQHEKLAALGKLSAGLAHELNNPAAANSRAASRLREALNELQQKSLALAEAGISSKECEAIEPLRQAALNRADADAAMPLDPLAQSDAEDALAAWLDEHDVGAGWEYAPSFAQAGLDAAWFDAAATQSPSIFAPFVAWLHAELEVHALVRMIETSTHRISDLVHAVKEYSYMDQAAVVEVDIHDGIENTVLMLQHKLRDVTITRHYDRSLPPITVRGSELNQVWTNLLDNAVDATNGRGHITIRTSREYDSLVVQIEDDGPGIPPDIQGRVWEPFFTTKTVGQGTGLGLDSVYRIVVERHGGDVRLESVPGHTRFTIRLPLQPPVT